MNGVIILNTLYLNIYKVCWKNNRYTVSVFFENPLKALMVLAEKCEKAAMRSTVVWN